MKKMGCLGRSNPKTTKQHGITLQPRINPSSSPSAQTFPPSPLYLEDLLHPIVPPIPPLHLSTFSPRRLVPTPNIQPNLGPRRNRVRSVPGLGIPSSIGPKILPKHRIPLNRLERDTVLAPLHSLTISLPFIHIAFQKPTPLFAHGHP